MLIGSFRVLRSAESQTAAAADAPPAHYNHWLSHNSSRCLLCLTSSQEMSPRESANQVPESQPVSSQVCF